MSDEELFAMTRVTGARCPTVTTSGTARMHRSTAAQAAAPSPARDARSIRREVTHAR
jgi:hypothetical protein